VARLPRRLAPLARSGAKRELIGEWQVLDAREAPAGEPMGLTGIRAGGCRARLRTEFRGDDRKDASRRSPSST
jgi:hypothetical protein